MATIPTKVLDRLSASVKKYQPIIETLYKRDASESDTVMLIRDLLTECFGFDRFGEITSEYSIKNTFVDLAVKINGVPRLLLEVKAIGSELKETHTKQAVDYAANAGVDWVVLSNARTWKIYRVIFAKPVDIDLIAEFDLLSMKHKSLTDIEELFLLTKEGLTKSALEVKALQSQACNRYVLAAVLQGDSVLQVIRQQLKKLTPGTRIEIEDIRDMMVNDILKRDVLEGEKATSALKRLSQLEKSTPKKRTDTSAVDAPSSGTDIGSETVIQSSTEY